MTRFFVASMAAALMVGAPLGSAWGWVPMHQCGQDWYARWLPSELPVQYRVNPSGAGVSQGQAVSLIEQCFNYWYEPCCSGARAEHAGTTSSSPTANGDQVNTVGFITGSWPRDLGDAQATLGVTMPLIWSDCHISEADIAFNEAAQDFCYSNCGQWDTAFEPVATHEIGHFFGLGHSNDSNALMYFAYTGGADGEPRDDDITGICTIYPDDHCQCTPGSCDPPLECVDGACVAPDPCAGVQCEDDEHCVGGDCVVFGQCSICAACTDNGPCGANGQCVARADGQGRCFEYCSAQGSCPGSSICFQATGGTEDVYVCLNPDAVENGFCPDSFTCTDCEATGCEPGEQCYDGACRPDPFDVVCADAVDGSCSGCSDASEGCFRLADGRFVCTVRCIDDGDCGPCGACMDTPEPRVRVCVNEGYESGICPADWTCEAPTDGDADADVDGVTDSGGGDGAADSGGEGGDDLGGRGGRCNCQAPGAHNNGESGGAAAMLALAALSLSLRRLRR